LTLPDPRSDRLAGRDVNKRIDMYGSGTSVLSKTAGVGVVATQLPETGANLLLLGCVAVLLLFLGFALLRVVSQQVAS
jgi:hypothetical protein